MATFEFIQESPVSGVGFVYKSETAAYYFDGTTVTQITDPDYPANTVPGIQYMDGTYYVMNSNGTVFGSEINDPLTWSALNVIQSHAEPDDGVYLGRQLNLLVSMGAYATEFFYSNPNPPAAGSPLLPYDSALVEVGCAAAGTVAQTDNSMFFVGVTKQKGRGIYRFVGTNPEYLSNPFIDRILNKDDMQNVTAFCIRISGHVFYVLYLGTVGITLVYDVTTQQFATWSVCIPQDSQNIGGLVWSNRSVTVTLTNHGFADGDRVVITGCTPQQYNGSHTISYIDANTFSYALLDNPGTATVLGTLFGYDKEPFAIASYTSGDNIDFVQDSTTGYIFMIDNGTYADNGNPIDVLIRTFKFDAGSTKEKFTSQIEIVGDKVESFAYLRYTDDDYQNWSKYRAVDLNRDKSMLSRMGRARRRAYEIRHHDTCPLRLEALEPSFLEGTN